MSGECDMMKYYSIRMKLDDVVKDIDEEQIILENVRRCSKLVGKSFKVVFWHVNLTEQNCKDFVKRNEHLLFEVNTQITKRIIPVWFAIGEGKDGRYTFDGDKSRWRYKSDGEILDGIASYIKLIKHMNKGKK